MNMYPMDFEEFLWAMGDEQMMSFIRDCYEKKQALGPLHRKVMDYFRHYMIVGGMPQAVLEYVETHDFMKVDMVKRNILSLYKADIEKYAVGNEIKVKAIFEEIPSALSKHEKKFRLTAISDKARYREYESSFFWLAESRVVHCRANVYICILRPVLMVPLCQRLRLWICVRSWRHVISACCRARCSRRW